MLFTVAPPLPFFFYFKEILQRIFSVSLSLFFFAPLLFFRHNPSFFIFYIRVFMSRNKVVYCVHDFAAGNADEISIKVGEKITVIEKDEEYEDGWWKVVRIIKLFFFLVLNFFFFLCVCG